MSRFTVGEWLEGLTDDELERIGEGFELPGGGVSPVVSDGRDLLSDLVEVCRLAVNEEQRRNKARVSVDLVRDLAVLASNVLLKRRGLIEISGVCALARNAAPPKITITELGRSPQAAMNILRRASAFDAGCGAPSLEPTFLQSQSAGPEQAISSSSEPLTSEFAGQGVKSLKQEWGARLEPLNAPEARNNLIASIVRSSEAGRPQIGPAIEEDQSQGGEQT
jgi:hypothetical protein